jgi:DNA-binding MarR family transcriptional regulator
VTDDMRDDRPDKARVVQLSQRDVDDAKRLLSILATAEGKIIIGSDVAGESSSGAVDGQSQERALELLSLRRKRERVFPRAMFGEPAWEILLLLYALGSRQTIGRLAELACASKSTTIRWIDYLEGQQLITRQPHPTDKRAVYAELTDKARKAVQLYLSGSPPARD